MGPLVAHGRRRAAGGAQALGGAGHPQKERGKRGSLGLGRKRFVVVVEMILVVI